LRCSVFLSAQQAIACIDRSVIEENGSNEDMG
jgi:hypothetical protein